MKVLLIAALLWSTELFSQDNQFLANKRNVIPGTRASLLGGAYSALSDDATGLYYNPAGMTWGPKDDLSISANAYFEKEVVYKGALNGKNFKEKSSGFFPSFIGGKANFSGMSAGWALVTLESQTHNQNAQFTDLSDIEDQAKDFNISHQQSSLYNLAGGGISFKIGSNFSFGISLFGYRRHIETSNHQMVAFNNGAMLFLNTKIDTDNLGAMGILGVQWRGSRHSLGINFRTYSSISDVSVLTRDSMSADAGSINPTQSSISGDSNFFDEMNTDTLRIGYAFFIPWLTISSELIYYWGTLGQSDQQELKDGYDLGLGLESKIGFLAMRLGAFTNNSLFEVPKEGDVGQSHHIDYVGYSFGFALLKRNTESSIGIVYQEGKGKSQKIAGSGLIQDVEANSFLVILGSTYEF